MNTALAIGAIVFLGGFYAWTGRINSIFFFGRSVGQEMRDSAEARSITRQYLVSTIGVTVLCLVLAWLGGRHGGRFASVGLLGEALAFSIVFARANRRVRALEVSRGWRAPGENVVQASLTGTPSYTVPGTALAVLPMVLGGIGIGAALFWTGRGLGASAAWHGLFSSIEAHHLDGLFGMSLGLLMTATALLLTFRVSVRLRTRMAQYSVRASVCMEWVGLALLLTVLGGNALGWTVTHAEDKAVMVAALAIVLGTMLWNQARAKRFVPPPVEMGADDRWRWGLFYVDRNDPALFVQSRCGAGYTLNYGRVLAWPISLAVAAYFVAVLFLPQHHN